VEVEFLDAAPADGPGEPLGGPGSRWRVVVAVAVLAVLVGAVLVARAVGGDGHPAAAGSSASPTTGGSATVHSNEAIRGATLGEAGQVELPVDAMGACRRSCAVALFVPGEVLDAVDSAFPGALVTEQFSVYATGDRSLLERRLTAELDRGRVAVTVTRHGLPVPAATTASAMNEFRIDVDRHGYHIRVAASGEASPDGAARLADDPKLLRGD
jgi:hypothetical protein